MNKSFRLADARSVLLTSRYSFLSATYGIRFLIGISSIPSENIDVDIAQADLIFSEFYTLAYTPHKMNQMNATAAAAAMKMLARHFQFEVTKKIKQRLRTSRMYVSITSRTASS